VSLGDRGRPGESLTGSAKLTVYRDGARIIELAAPGGGFALPAGDATYGVTAEATRGAPVALSTRVDAAWTFRSSHVDGAAPVALPLLTVRFAPPLDASNTAAAGRTVTIPVTVDRQGGAGAATALSVQVSFDDGKTWQPVRVAGGRVQVRQPQGHGYVSLKAAASDRNGNTVEETVLHAYRY